MIKKFIEVCLRNRFIVITVFAFLILASIWAVKETPVDAIPDIGEMQIIVFADWPGRSPKDIENQVIYPLTTQLMGTPKMKVVRSFSGFSMGMVNVIFKEGTDYYWARTRVLERMDVAKRLLPAEASVYMAPDATALGQIFWYTVENGYYCPKHPQKAYEKPGKCPIDREELIPSQYDLGGLRSIQDWYVRYQLTSAYGVAEVASVGGYVKQYQIDVDPNKMLAHNVKLNEVIMAVRRSNIDVGAKVFEEGGMQFVVRGVGFIKTVEDIESIVVGAKEGVPVYIRNIGAVTIGSDFRIGALDKEGKEVTGGVVLMRIGENPLRVTERVKAKISELELGLPPGIRIVPFYDRTGLIKRTISTLNDALVQEIIVSAAVVVVFLLHIGASFITTLIFPLGVLLAFLMMKFLHIEANVMSLGGIAIAIGILDDCGSVIAENIYRRIAEAQRQKETGKVVLLTPSERLKVCTEGAQEVGPSVFTALLTTLVGFIPMYVLTGQAGKLFKPLAWTKSLAMISAMFIGFALLPVLSYYLLRGKLQHADENITARFIRKIYKSVISWALNHKKIIVSISLAIMVTGVVIVPRIKREFMPPLNEGDLLFMPVMLPGVSLTQAMEVLQNQDKILKEQFPQETEWVVGKVGRASTATDPAPIEMLETIIHLKPEKEWRKGITREKLISEMIEATRIPGVSPIMTQPIRNRIDMLATGIQTPVGIKVFGPDLQKIEEIAIQIERIMSGVKGAVGPYAERIGNRPYFEIEIDRQQIARYGVRLGDVQDIITAAVGGANITTTIEGRERYPVRVRYMRELRDNAEAIKRIFVPTSSGAQVPLSQLARFEKKPGPAMISSENAMTYARIFINVDPGVIGIVDFVGLAKKTLAQKIKSGELILPSGYYISWSGQYESEMEARKTLAIALPLCLVFIFFLIYLQFKDVVSLTLSLVGLPISIAGGAILLYLFHFNFSTAVWVGFIAVFGVATDNAVILIAFLNDLFKEKKISSIDEIKETVSEGGLVRVRALTMTTLTTIIGLLPVMFFTSAGSEIMKPMATPTIGGLTLATFANLILVPVLYCWIKERKFKNLNKFSSPNAE